MNAREDDVRRAARRTRRRDWCPVARARRRGALLLEAVLAVSIFVAFAIAILGMVGDSASALTRARDETRAADLARSTITKLEAGIGNVRTLAGPVARWEEDPTTREGDEGSGPEGGFSDAPPTPSLWEVQIETDRSEFEGLTHVTVRAFKRASPESDRAVAAYTLRQLVRLSADAQDRAGEEDALGEAARRGAERSDRRPGERPVPAPRPDGTGGPP